MRLRVFIIGTVLAMLSAQCSASHDKTVWSYEGGIFMITNGSIPNGPCFRLTGRVTAGDFFDHLKRYDKPTGTIFRRGYETVVNFPDQLTLSISVHDWQDKTCPPRPEDPTGESTPQFLTREMMSTLDLYLYWKHGVELRPVRNVERKYFAVREVVPKAAARMYNLQQKLEWNYEYVVPSAGVPLSDSLVLILRTRDNQIAARVSARL